MDAPTDAPHAHRHGTARPEHSEHAADATHPTLERHCDVAVIGGSAAGLAAALQLSRQRRSVLVVDDGTPRNAPAEHMHNYLSRDGTAPSELLAIGRAEVTGYGGRSWRVMLRRSSGCDAPSRARCSASRAREIRSAASAIWSASPKVRM